MRKPTGNERHTTGWAARPEWQDLQDTTSGHRWAVRTAGCPSKKAWKTGKLH